MLDWRSMQMSLWYGIKLSGTNSNVLKNIKIFLKRIKSVKTTSNKMDIWFTPNFWASLYEYNLTLDLNGFVFLSKWYSQVLLIHNARHKWTFSYKNLQIYPFKLWQSSKFIKKWVDMQHHKMIEYQAIYYIMRLFFYSLPSWRCVM